jgi:hypothetical protein
LALVLKIRVSGVRFPPWPFPNSIDHNDFASGPHGRSRLCVTGFVSERSTKVHLSAHPLDAQHWFDLRTMSGSAFGSSSSRVCAKSRQRAGDMSRTAAIHSTDPDTARTENLGSRISGFPEYS